MSGLTAVNYYFLPIRMVGRGADIGFGAGFAIGFGADIGFGAGFEYGAGFEDMAGFIIFIIFMSCFMSILLPSW